MRATTNENVDTIFTAAISKKIAVLLVAIVHVTVILDTICPCPWIKRKKPPNFPIIICLKHNVNKALFLDAQFLPSGFSKVISSVKHKT